MATTLASRRAAGTLIRVITILVVPMLVLWLIFYFQARKDIQQLSLELVGANLAEVSFPIFLGGSTGNDLLSDPKIEEFESGLNLPPDYRLTSGNPVANNEANSRSDALKLITLEDGFSTYAKAVAASSQLIFDNDPESHFLINAALINLPDAISGRERLNNTLAQAIKSETLAETDLRRLMKHVGNADEALERLHEALTRAHALSTSPSVYDSMLQTVFRIESDIGELAGVLEGTNGLKGELAFKVFQSKVGDRNDVKADARRFLNSALGLLKMRLQQRVTTLNRNLWVLTTFGLVFSLCGIAMAAIMFRNTLVKLDGVDEARLVSETARQEAVKINDQVAHLNRDLANKVQQLRDAQDDLVKRGRMEQLGQLTATIAHELRNPLGAVRTSTFLLERRLKNKELGLEPQFERINKSIVRCDNIITQLLDYSRIKNLDCKAEVLDDWLAGVVEDVSKSIPEVVRIQCILGLNGAAVKFDPSRMERAVINLMNNASEAMVGNGTEPKKFTTTSPLIIVTTELIDGMVQIAVADNGPGISVEDLSRIREPLFTTKSFGTGLGIPAIEQIALQHGGKLEVHSVLGQGATFKVTLPNESVLGESALAA